MERKELCLEKYRQEGLDVGVGSFIEVSNIRSSKRAAPGQKREAFVGKYYPRGPQSSGITCLCAPRARVRGQWGDIWRCVVEKELERCLIVRWVKKVGEWKR